MCVVLLITDNEVIKRRTEAMLEGMRFEVVVAATETAVARSCVASRPGIVISDIETQAGVGFESISTVRRLASDAYIIAISRSEDQDLWLRVARACGADEYVPGPLTMSSLVDAIDACKNKVKYDPGHVME